MGICLNHRSRCEQSRRSARGPARWLVRTGLLALALGLLPASLAAGPALADNPPAPQPTGPAPQSLIDGCQRDPAALIAAQTPEWAYVYNTPSDQPAPPPRWVSGYADSFNHAFQSVHTSGADFAFGHDSLDYNVNVRQDSPDYDYLLAGSPNIDPQIGSATGNYAGNGEESNRLHTEWEDLTVPKFAWNEPGDRITELGSWVWDCGHWGTPTNVFSPDYDLPAEGQPCPTPFAGDPSQCTITGEHTEFHPYRALFDQRKQSAESPYGENQAELLVSTDKTRAGKTADCAHKFPPPPSAVLPNPAAYPPAFAACVETEPNWQDVTGDYSFFVPAPPKPTPDARLTFRTEDKGSVNAPAPTLTQEGDGVRITFHLDSAQSQRVVMARRVFVGWDTLPLSAVPTHLRVTFDHLDVHRAMDPGCSRQQPVPGCQLQSTRQNQATTAPGDWNIYWDVNGIWGAWPPGELLVNDRDVLPGSQTVDLYVPPGKGWRLFVHGRECDINGVNPARPLLDCPTNDEVADNNDVQGLIEDVYSSADASLGLHTSDARTAGRNPKDPTSTCPDANPQGCYSLTYTVSKIDDAASRVRLPDLAVTKSDSPDPVFVGDQLTYTIPVSNHGPATAGGVTVTDNLPSSVSFVSATPSQGSCGESSGTVTCALGTLASGDSTSIELKVTPKQAGTITNNVSVASNETDGDTSDNSAQQSTTVTARYARPKGATPAVVSLVPAFNRCDNPNSTHGAPLAQPSCDPPVPASSRVTVGTPDSNGEPAKAAGLIREDVAVGDPATPADEADVTLAVRMTDVREKSDLSDYGGELAARTVLRITDRYNGASGTDQATLADTPFAFAVPCTPTADATVGSSCSVMTSADAVMPGIVPEGKRSIWELGQFELFDGGADGAAASPGDNTLFAVQGIFVP